MHGGEKGKRKALIRRRCGPVEGEVAPNGEHNEGPVQSVVRALGRNRFEMERMSPSRCSPRQTTCKDHSPGTSAGIPFARCYIGDFGRQPVGSPLAGINSQSSFHCLGRIFGGRRLWNMRSTLALQKTVALGDLHPQADHFGTRFRRTPAASNRWLRSMASPHLEIRPDQSTSPETWRLTAL